MCGSLLESQWFWASRGLEVGWGLAGWLAEFAKNVGTKRSYTPPLGGKKTQAFLVAPPKGSFVGWLVIWNFNFNMRSKRSISTGEVGSRHSFRASQMSEKFDRSSLEIFSYPISKILVRRKLSSCRMSKILGCRKLSKRSCKIFWAGRNFEWPRKEGISTILKLVGHLEFQFQQEK